MFVSHSSPRSFSCATRSEPGRLPLRLGTLGKRSASSSGSMRWLHLVRAPPRMPFSRRRALLCAALDALAKPAALAHRPLPADSEAVAGPLTEQKPAFLPLLAGACGRAAAQARRRRLSRLAPPGHHRPPCSRGTAGDRFSPQMLPRWTPGSAAGRDPVVRAQARLGMWRSCDGSSAEGGACKSKVSVSSV